MVHFRSVFFIIGILLCVLAGAMLLPAIADLARGHADWRVFVVSAAVTLFVAVSLMLAARTDQIQFRLRDAFALTTLSWTVLAVFASLPFAFATLGMRYVDAFFEAMSGLTATGSTVIVGLDEAAPSILLWRGLLQWLGGAGIIAMAIAVMPVLRVGGMQLFQRESTDRSDKVMPRAAEIAAGIGVIFVALTAVCMFAYWLLGMNGLEAMIHAMTTIATGGFSTSDRSIAHFDSPAIELVAIVFMTLGGMTFTLYLRLQQGDWRAVVRDAQTRLYLALIAVFTVPLALWHAIVNAEEPLSALRHAGFTVVSILTGTGYASTDYGTWGGLPVAVVFMLSFVGGCSGSTTGGMKIFRFQILAALAYTHIRNTLHPSGVFVPKFNRRQITEGVTQSVLAFFFLYIASFAMLTMALALTGLDLVTAISGAATAIGNVGPGLGDVIGPSGTFAPLPDAAKWLLSFGMLLGRLEFLTVLVMLTPAFWRR